MHDVYEKDPTKNETASACKGTDVNEMWECEWTSLKQTSPDIQTYVDSLQFVEPSQPA